MSEEIKQALDTLKLAFKNDPEYAWSWHCNIAMPMYDSFAFNGTNSITYFEANVAAARIMHHLFNVDMVQNQLYINCIKSHTQINAPEIKIVDDSPEAYEQIKEAFSSTNSGVSVGVIVSPELARGQNPSFIHIDESPFVGSQDTNKEDQGTLND